MSAVTVVPAGAREEPRDAAPDSLLADLRTRAAAQRADKSIDLEVGGEFGDVLVVRYGVLDVHELERYAQLQGSIGNMELALEMLVATARGFYYRQADGPLIELADERGPIRGYGQRLAVLLGHPMPEGIDELAPRDVIVSVFGHNAMQLGAHVTRLVDWMTNPGGDAPD